MVSYHRFFTLHMYRVSESASDSSSITQWCASFAKFIPTDACPNRFVHGITMEAFTPICCMTCKNYRNEYTSDCGKSRFRLDPIPLYILISLRVDFNASDLNHNHDMRNPSESKYSLPRLCIKFSEILRTRV